ncbi:TonB-dependent receptor [Pontiella agarivorans]|uniref:TonB-dependent receptor n=1 Tax=Pontiella agarivorans TaxID=3038953 RepID=A0ABU5MYT1_9BACT|nr:TonB-dependent receptor [Pontiella agarivorans]MDZ8119338.1 TonB-dependent receptor [Pontiella agarivorans]
MKVGLLCIFCLIFLGSALAEVEEKISVYAWQQDELTLLPVDTAADVTVIDRETIEASGAVSVPDLLRNEANVMIRNTSGNVNDGQVAMRGFGENSHLRTLILVDGHTLNRPDMGVAGWESLPVMNIEQIEVIRGGQNVLYGDNALAGVISITTKRGADAGTQVLGTMGEFGYLSGYIGHGGAAGPVDYYAGIDRYESEGFRSNSLSRATVLTGSLAWYANDSDMVSLRVSHTDSYRQYPGPLLYDQMMEDPTQSYYSGDEYAEDLESRASLIWKTSKSWGEARVVTGISRRENEWQLPGRSADELQYGFSLGPRVKLGSADNFLLTGVDASYDTLDHTNDLQADPDYASSEGMFSRVTVQPYVFMQKTLRERWIVGGGARYEHATADNDFNDYIDNQILPYIDTNRGPISNPNYNPDPDQDPLTSYDEAVKKEGWAATLSLTRKFNRNFEGWVRYDRCYRYPTLDEAAAYNEFELSEPLNTRLDPEEGNHFVTGVQWGNGLWRFQWSAYALFMDNEIVYDQVLMLNRNLGKTKRLGTEFEVAWDREWYGANTRWAVQDARLAGGEYEGNVIPLVSPYHGVVSGWIDPVERLRLTLTWSYVAEQYQGNDDANILPKMDAYGLLGLHADIRMSPRIRLNISMENLLDEIYATTAYSGVYYPGAGRSFRCSMMLEF